MGALSFLYTYPRKLKNHITARQGVLGRCQRRGNSSDSPAPGGHCRTKIPSCPSPSVLYPRLPQKQHLPMTSSPKADTKSKIVMETVVTTSTVVCGIFLRALSPPKNTCKDSSTCAYGASSIHH